MKLSSIVCVSIAALAAVALTTDGSFAAKTYNASHSNTANVIINPADENTCAAAGGKISTDSGGRFCSVAIRTGPSGPATNSPDAMTGHNGCKASEVQGPYGCEPRPKN